MKHRDLGLKAENPWEGFKDILESWKMKTNQQAH